MPTIAEIRQLYPSAADLTDHEIVQRLGEVSGMGTEGVSEYLGYKPSANAWKDTAIDAAKGVAGLMQVGTGGLNLMTGGRSGALMREHLGGDLEDVKKELSRHYSGARQVANQNVDNAEGFVGTAKAILANPRNLAGTVVEGLPSMLLPGGVAARAAKAGMAAKGVNAVNTAGWATVTGTQIADRINHEQPDNVAGMYTGAALGAAATGALTHGFSFLPGGHMAKEVGGLKGRGLGVANEGVMSGTEGGIQTASENVAMDRPWEQGISKGIASGLVGGAAMGWVGAGGRQKAAGTEPLLPDFPTLTDIIAPEDGIPVLNDVLEKAPMYGAPDGTVMNKREADAYAQFAPGLQNQQPAPQQDPAAAQLAATKAGKTAGKPYDPGFTEEQRAAIYSKYGDPKPNMVKHPEKGEVQVGHHFDTSDMPDKNGRIIPLTSPDKIDAHIAKLVKADAEKGPGQLAAEQSLSDAVLAELGRRPRSKELEKVGKEIDLAHTSDPVQLVGHIDVALAKMEGKKNPDMFLKDALTIWRKTLDKSDSLVQKVDVDKPEKKDVAKAPEAKQAAPQGPKAPVAVVPPAPVAPPARVVPGISQALGVAGPKAEPGGEAAPAALQQALAAMVPKQEVALTDTNGKTSVLTPEQWRAKITKPNEKDRLGYLVPEDGSPPLTFAQIALLESQKYGKKVGATAIGNWAKKLGITKDTVDAANSIGLNTVDAAELDIDGESSAMRAVTNPNSSSIVNDDANMTGAMKRTQREADEILAKNKSTKVDEVQTVDEQQRAAEMAQRRQDQAEFQMLKTMHDDLTSALAPAAKEEYRILRTSPKHARWETLTEKEQAAWIGLYRVNEAAALRGADSALEQMFNDFQKDLEDVKSIPAADRNLLGTGVPADPAVRGADPAGRTEVVADLPRDGAGRSDGPVRGEAVRSDDAESRPADGDAVQAKDVAAPKVAVKKRRVAVKPDGVKFGKERGAVEDGYTRAELKKELQDFMGTDSLGRNVIIVDTAIDLVDLTDVTIAMAEADAFGWTRDGKAVMIADRITKGQGRAKFMHEVGSHLGLDRLLDGGDRDVLAMQIESWAKDSQGIEGEIARAALKRVKDAKTEDGQTFSETIAYFIEEAVQRGIDPTAVSYKTPLDRWFRTMWASFKKAIRNLRSIDPNKLTAQDVVNMAYGAARLEVTGTWHGAAAKFRKFDHKYMGTGEGAQAYGWGTYAAERRGIARNYMEADVRRKGGPRGAAAERARSSYEGDAKVAKSMDAMVEAYKKNADDIIRLLHSGKHDDFNLTTGQALGQFTALKYGMNYHEDLNKALFKTMSVIPRAITPDDITNTLEAILRGKPVEGLLHRVDYDIKPDEWMKYDALMSEQSETVQKAFASPGLKEFLDEYGFDEAGLEEATLGEVYHTLAENMGSESIEVTANGKTQKFGGMGTKGDKEASRMLDALGVKGLKHLDSTSRNKSSTAASRVEQMENSIRIIEGNIKYTQKEIDDNRGNTGLLPQFFTRREGEIAASRERIEKIQREIKSVKAEADNLTSNRVIFNDKNIQRVASLTGADQHRVKFGKNAREENIRRLPAQLQKPVRSITTTIHQVGTRAAQASAFMHDLADWADKHDMPTMKKIAKVMAQKGAYKHKKDTELGKLAEDFSSLKEKDQKAVQQFLLDSTMQQKWGYQPTWRDEVKIDSAAEAHYNQLSPEAKAAADQMLRHGDEMWKEKQQAIHDLAHAHVTEQVSKATAEGRSQEEIDGLWKELEKLIKPMAKMDGPYVPLKRFGNYVVTLKSAELLDAEKSDRKKYNEMLSDPAHYRREDFDSAGRAEARARELEGMGTVEWSEKEAHTYLGAGHEVLQRLSDAAQERLNGREYSDEDRKFAGVLARTLNEAIIQSLGEYNARSSSLQRKNVAGVNPDEVGRAFFSQGFADNQFLASVKHNREMNDYMAQLRAEKDTGGDRTAKQNFYNEFQARQANSLKEGPAPWVGHAMRFTSLWKLVTLPAYYLQYISQPLTMFLPLVQGEHGGAKSWGALIGGYKDMYRMARGLKGTDVSALKDANERKMIEDLTGTGTIGIGHEQTMGRIETLPTGSISKVWAKATNKLTQFPHDLEMHNRIAASLTAYRLAIGKGMKHEAAVEYTRSKINQGFGDYSSYNAPRIMQGGSANKLIMQYRQFQLIHTALLVRLLNNAFKGESKDVRKAARAQLMYMAGHYSVLAGGLGIPGAHVIGGAIKEVFGDDDIDEDLETFVKRHAGGAADMILGGVPRAVFGQDLSSRMGAGDILSPFRGTGMVDALGSKKDYKDFTIAALGPFIGSMVPQVIDGVDTIQKGDYYRGLEQLMPTGVGAAMKAYRYADEGVVSKRGLTTTKAEDISGGDLLATLVGSRPVSTTEPAHDAAMVGKIQMKFRDKSFELKNRFAKARKAGDDVEGIVEEWKELNTRMKAAGLKPAPLSELYKAVQQINKRNQMMIDGVPYTKSTKGLVQKVTDDGEEEE